MKWIKLYEEYSEDWLIKKVDHNEFYTWEDEHSREFFTKEDMVVILNLFYSLKESYPGKKIIQLFKVKESGEFVLTDSFELGQIKAKLYLKPSFLIKDEEFIEFFNSKLSGYSIIHIKNVGEKWNHSKGTLGYFINISKFKDEWYSFDMSKTGNGDEEILFLCDSIDGLKEIKTELVKKNLISSWGINLNESKGDDWLVKQVSSAEFFNWSAGRKQDFFKKEDTILSFDIIQSLPFNYFGRSVASYPFNKTINYWYFNISLGGTLTGLNGLDIDEISDLPDKVFTKLSYTDIHTGNSDDDFSGWHVNISKYVDEWYSITIIGNRNEGKIVMICDSIDGLKEVKSILPNIKEKLWISLHESKEDDIKKEIDDYLNRKRDYPDLISTALYLGKDKKSEWWDYMGERNGVEWSKNIQELFTNQSYRPMGDNELKQISGWLSPVLSPLSHNKGWNPITKRGDQDWVCYPTKKDVSNSRFENCWFLLKGKDMWGHESGWDMCVQGFTDEWYLINVGDGSGHYSYWFRVDTLEGLHNFINEHFIKTYEAFKKA